MKYYRIEKSIDPKVIGVKDGSAQAELTKKSFVDKNRYDEYIDYFLSYKEGWFDNQAKFPSFDFDLQYLKLKKQAQITDFICFAPAFYHKFLINDKVQNILGRYNVSSYKLYNVSLYGDNTKIFSNYKFLFSPSLSYDHINFSKSVFSLGNSRTGKEFIVIHSLEEFLSIDKPLNRERLVLKSNKFDTSLDYFNLLIFPDPIISENLKEGLISESVTGINIVEFDLEIE